MIEKRVKERRGKWREGKRAEKNILEREDWVGECVKDCQGVCERERERERRVGGRMYEKCDDVRENVKE